MKGLRRATEKPLEAFEKPLKSHYKRPLNTFKRPLKGSLSLKVLLRGLLLPHLPSDRALGAIVKVKRLEGALGRLGKSQREGQDDQGVGELGVTP